LRDFAKLQLDDLSPIKRLLHLALLGNIFVGKNMRFSLKAAGIFLWLTLLSGCQKNDNKNLPVVVIGLTSDFDTLLELGTANSDALHVIEEMLFLTLCELDESLNLQPRLAKSWQMSDGGKKITFTLRDDVLWSDGQPTTADDVLFTYQLAVNPQVGYTGRDRFAAVDTVTVPDAQTICFTFKKNYPEALLDLQIPILPKHVLANVPPEQLRQCAFNRQPIGNGPFVLKEWRANDRAVFEANDRYFAGRPKLDRVVFRIVPDETVLFSSVRTGEIDLLPYIPPHQVSALDHDTELRLVKYPDRGYSFLGLNLQRPVFADGRVRQAVAKAIDRQNLIAVLLNGHGRLIPGPIPPYFWAYDESLPVDIFNPGEAEDLLDLAGWVDRDQDGWREKDGAALEFTMKTNADNKLRSDALVMMQADLQKVGVKAQPELMEFGKLVEDVMQRRDFDALLLSWKTGYAVDPSPVWHSNAIANGYNLISYRNSRVDSLLEMARQELDRVKAKPLWCEFQRLVARDCPYVFLYNQENTAVVRRRLQNVKMDMRGYLINIETWSVGASNQRGFD
jgi:peptide/nickel transport system substrate-binding protein